MSNKNDGGNAFPHVQDGWTHADQGGLSIRDYFAAKALTGLIGRVWQDETTGKTPDDIFDRWAKAAYATADAMIAARSAA